MMEFIILQLTYKGNENKNKSIKQASDMTSTIVDEEVKLFLLSGVAVFTNKLISQEYDEEIRRLLGMTKVGRLLEEEKNYAKDYTKEQQICCNKFTFLFSVLLSIIFKLLDFFRIILYNFLIYRFMIIKNRR